MKIKKFPEKNLAIIKVGNISEHSNLEELTAFINDPNGKQELENRIRGN